MWQKVLLLCSCLWIVSHIGEAQRKTANFSDTTQFLFFDTSADNNQAIIACEAVNASLARVSSDAKFNFIEREIVNDLGVYDTFWIGSQDVARLALTIGCF